jgi:primosomal protein N' (replication factor Y)
MESEQHILSVAVPRPLEGLFTYRISSELASKVLVGGMVTVPFGRSKTHAFVVEPPRPLSEIPEHVPLENLKDIISVDEQGSVLPPDVLALCKWAHDYYRSPLGEVLNCAAPPASVGLKSTKKKARAIVQLQAGTTVQLTEEQAQALEKLEKFRAEGPKVALLNGVTGSGKTELYIELAKKTLAEGRGVVLLVPEIALTSQLHRRFETALGYPVAVWHSAVSDGKRRDFGAALRDGDVRVVVGARSAVFAPVPNLGLIIVDEEHDPTYKQEDRVRYHARDLAVVRGKISQAFVVLGSATPSLETRERVREGRYGEAQLKHRVAPGGLPEIEIVDLCVEERVEESRSPLAKKTLKALQETLAAGDQAMIFLNRRGFASFLVCEDCGEVPGCPSCSISLTVHMKSRQLRCHVCGFVEAIHDSCQKCQSLELSPVGSGTESLEEELPKLVEGLVPLRLDRDQVTSVKRLESILSDFREKKANVLLGTQMLVKGHDFPGVTLVIVVLADALFRWPDFRATERAYQILTQVAGRAGRGQKAGRVMIQTFGAQHDVIRAVKGEVSEEAFLEGERELRQALAYSPFGRLARLRWEGDDQRDVQKQAQFSSTELAQAFSGATVEFLGPSEAFLERAKGVYRWDLLIKSPDIQVLQKSVSAARQLATQNKWRLVVDIDPYGVG